MFSDLHIRPNSDHAIDVFSSGQRIKSFEVYESHHSPQVILQWFWDFGRKRQVDCKRQKCTCIIGIQRNALMTLKQLSKLHARVVET